MPHLFQSNTPPSESEIITIRASISDAEAYIEELRRRRVPTRIHAKLLKFIEVHKALLNPVRYLPSDVVQEIFLCYADDRAHDRSHSQLNNPIAIIPWSLGHISHRWREIALSLPSLWDNIPKTSIGKILNAKPNLQRSYIPAWTCLIQRSGASPSLKLDINCCLETKVTKHPIVDEIIRHSERIEKLHIVLNHTNLHLFHGFKDRLPNLRILHLDLAVSSDEMHSLDVFETAPALWKVTLGGHKTDQVKVALPWSQITHFEEQLQNKRIGPPFVLFSSLTSLTHLDIDRYLFNGLIPLTLYEPITLPNLRTLRMILPHFNRCDEEIAMFLESLTIPTVEVITVKYMGSLVPRLLSMLSRSHEPSRLRKLSLSTIPLPAGELRSLLQLTPHLIELDINVPPVLDLYALISDEGIVPMLQVLYIHSFATVGRAQAKYFNKLAQSRCELGRKDSEEATMPSLANRTPLDKLSIVLTSAEDRDYSQKTLNNWWPFLNQEESRTLEVLMYCRRRLRHSLLDCRLDLNRIAVEHVKLIFDTLDQVLGYIRQCDSETITHEVLCVSRIFLLASACIWDISYCFFSSGNKHTC